MGLDMYLSEHVYVGEDDEIKGAPASYAEGKPSYIIFEAMYWRKANQIHKWFVDNVQGGKDNCGEYDVPIEKLEELLDTVNQVLEDNSKAGELLPTESGFFFGSTAYDNYYFEDLSQTYERLHKIVEAYKNDNAIWKHTFTYQSSW